MRFTIRFLIAVMTVFAVVIYYLPGRPIHLNKDMLTELSDGSAEDDEHWKSLLGRNERTLTAWASVNEVNAKWQRKQYRGAIEGWWLLAREYRDTDAALAALDNVARAEMELGNIEGCVQAWELTLLLPEIRFVNGGFNQTNFRHDACVALSKHYESKGNFAFAERFVSQALYQDKLHDFCGVYASSVTLALEVRLAALRAKQGK